VALPHVKIKGFPVSRGDYVFDAPPVTAPSQSACPEFELICANCGEHRDDHKQSTALSRHYPNDCPGDRPYPGEPIYGGEALDDLIAYWEERGTVFEAIIDA